MKFLGATTSNKGCTRWGSKGDQIRKKKKKSMQSNTNITQDKFRSKIKQVHHVRKEN